MIWVRVLVPHDHLQRYSLVELEDTPDLRVRIAKGFLEVTDERGDRLPTGRDNPHRVR